jgi:hypothetical protein
VKTAPSTSLTTVRGDGSMWITPVANVPTPLWDSREKWEAGDARHDRVSRLSRATAITFLGRGCDLLRVP